MDDLTFTSEELKELERARTMPVTFDEDCPETTPERAVKFRRVNPQTPFRRRQMQEGPCHNDDNSGYQMKQGI